MNWMFVSHTNFCVKNLTLNVMYLEMKSLGIIVFRWSPEGQAVMMRLVLL